jgi:hypothetical protein
MPTNQAGPTLADMKGARRYRKLRKSESNLYDQVLERLASIAIIRHEMSELEAIYLGGLVDRPDLGELRMERWL